MKVLLMGGNGFVGGALLNNAPANISITPTYCNHPPAEKDGWIQFNLFQACDWDGLLSKFDCVIVAARPNGSTRRERDEVARKTNIAFSSMLEARRAMEQPPHVFAVHGTLSYGDCGPSIVNTSQPYNPVGYATSYGIGESPLRTAAMDGELGVIRAPWILGNGSWFNDLYLTNAPPLLPNQPIWMSVVEVNDLAQQIWQQIELGTTGIVHPQLMVRTTQERFAKTVAKVRQLEPAALGKWHLFRRYDRQTRQSILASVRLSSQPDGDVEGKEAHQRLEEAIQSLLAGRS